MTAVTCQPPLTRLRPPRLAALPEVTAALAAQAAGHDRDGSFPEGGISLVHDAGLLTATVARRYGGAGAGLATTTAILRALGQGDPSVALVTAMTLLTHAMQAHGGTWPRRIYEEVLQESAGRPVLINALRPEPELGTPARGGLPATVARWHSGTWWLSGRKIFSTGAVGLRWMVVWARTDEDPARVGRPLATLPRFETAVGEIETALTGANDLVRRAGAARGRRRRDGGRASRDRQAHRDQGRHRRGGAGRGPRRKQRPDQEEPTGTALQGRALRPGAHPAGRHHPVHGRRAALAADRRNPTKTTGAR